MKNISRAATALLSLLTLASQVMCYGQDPSDQTNLWLRVEKANSKIEASDVMWRAVMTLPAHKPLSKERKQQILARSKAKAEQSGKSPQEVAELVELAKDTFTSRESAQRITSVLHFVRIGQTIKCDIAFVDTKDEAIDFFDGRNSLFIETKVKGDKKSKPIGRLGVEKQHILSHSAPTWQSARFLTGMPLSEQYSPLNPSFNRDNSSIKLSQGKMTLERQVTPGQPGVAQEYPALLRLALSDTYLPLSYEDHNTLYQNAATGLIGKVSISGYKSYSSGIQFPSRVVIDAGVYKIEYSLQSAKFNDSVDPSSLKLPPNTLVFDSRFGRGPKTVAYQMKDGKPLSDAQVLKLLGEKPQEVVAMQKAHESASTATQTSTKAPWLPLAGVFMLIMGGMLWYKKD